MKPRTAIVIGGLTWLAVGVFLLAKGIHLVALFAYSLAPESSGLLMPYVLRFAGDPQQAALVLIACGLALGLVKGRAVLAKVAQKNIARLLTLSKISLAQIYPLRTWGLIGGMILLGIALRWVPQDLRGLIDVTIGSGLIHGALTYLRCAVIRPVA